LVASTAGAQAADAEIQQNVVCRFENVYFETNRAQTGSRDPLLAFGSKPGPLVRGIAGLNVCTTDGHYSSVRIYSVAPADNLTVATPSGTPRKDDDRRGTFLIHGYRTTWTSAVTRGFMLRDQLALTEKVTVFIWPSHGSLVGYIWDTSEIDASIADIERSVVRFLKTHEEGRIIAHSMGSRGLIAALYRISVSENRGLLSRLKTIIFAAADVDAAVMDRDYIPIAKMYGVQTFVYVSTEDWAMFASTWVNGKNRVGSVCSEIYVRPSIATVDVSLVEKSASGHTYVFDVPVVREHLKSVLGKQPQVGPWSFVLHKVQLHRGAYYVLLPPSREFDVAQFTSAGWFC
jgi:hypothetical protein